MKGNAMLPRIAISNCNDMQTIVFALTVLSHESEDARGLMQYIIGHTTAVHKCENTACGVESMLDAIQTIAVKQIERKHRAIETTN